jgi:uncharacterized protein
MRLVNLVISASIVFFVIGGVNILLFWFLHPAWWQRKILRYPVVLMPFLASGSAILWAVAFLKHWTLALFWGMNLAPTLFILESALLVTLPISSIIHSIIRVIDKLRRKKGDFSPGRRRFIKGAAAVFPVTAMAGGMTGVIDSYSDISVPIIKIPIPDLPGPLFGLRIAHLSDLHLGYYIYLRDLQKAIDKIREQRPDLVLLTGDISDDLSQLPQVLEMVDSLEPRFGTYACVGNHEYYRGIEEVMSIFQKAPFPMLINRHVNLNIGGVPVYLGGADDPRYLRQDYSKFLQTTIDHTMGAASPESFKILMCHRPEGLNHAATRRIDLVLAGHTHGGQVGFAGRSAFETLFPEKYLWGLYQKGSSTLYTSGGMGHWFPFRLGIPTEAPILILEKA